MTKYILAGGNDRGSAEYGQKLATEVNKTAKNPPVILSCLFAESTETRPEKFPQKKLWFRQLFGPEVEVELASPENFRDQIKRTDIIYLHGGDDIQLIKELKKYDDIRELFADKIVIGSSAGTIALAEKNWTCDLRKVVDGLGLVQTNTIVHFDSETYGKDDPRGPIDWNKAEQELRNIIGQGSKITKLPEGSFEVFES